MRVHTVLYQKIALAAALVLLCFGSAPAWAAVEISFYSREFGGTSFPHAFVTLKGELEQSGAPVDESYGFTAKTISPAILFGSVAGEVITEKGSFIARSDRQFSLTLSDEQYWAAREVVERWRTRDQPSYNLDRRNCVHFVGEIAEAIGLEVEYPKDLMKKPRSFLLALKDANTAIIDRRPVYGQTE